LIPPKKFISGFLSQIILEKVPQQKKAGQPWAKGSIIRAYWE
jgi:hypothetical protein